MGTSKKAGGGDAGESVTYARVVGLVIADRRRRAGLTQDRMAQALHTRQSAYSRLENGRHAVTVATLRAIASAMGTTPSSILSEADGLAERLERKGTAVRDRKRGRTGKGGGTGARPVAGAALADMVSAPEMGLPATRPRRRKKSKEDPVLPVKPAPEPIAPAAPAPPLKPWLL